MTKADFLQHLEAELWRAGIDQAKAETRMMFGALGVSQTELLLSLREPISNEHARQLEAWLERRRKREPLQHILGKASFYGLELEVNPDVLIPRPETETLAELALAEIKNRAEPKALDIGTGSGVIALTIKHEYPKAQVMATDISEAALQLARRNAAEHHLDVMFLHSDLLEAAAVQAFVKTADVLVANLPYLPAADKATVPPELHYDPEVALYAGVDGLELFRGLLPAAQGLLKTGAVCLFELDPRNIQQAFELSGAWARRKIFPDLLGRERFLRLER